MLKALVAKTFGKRGVAETLREFRYISWVAETLHEFRYKKKRDLIFA